MLRESPNGVPEMQLPVIKLFLGVILTSAGPTNVVTTMSVVRRLLQELFQEGHLTARSMH